MMPVELFDAAALTDKANRSGDTKAVEAAAKDFEAVFVGQMLKPMWEGIEADPMFGGGPGEDAFRDLLVQEYGKSMASTGNFGLSDSVMNEIIRMQAQAAL